MANKTINWEAIHQHLASTQQMLVQDQKSPELAKRILRARATELANEILITHQPAGTHIVEFKLGPEHYGIEATLVTRICAATHITCLHTTPEFIEGIMNLHGMLVCVVNLKKLFNLPNVTRNPANRVLIVNHENTYLGILVDDVIKIETIRLNTLQSSLPTLNGLQAEFLLGITPDQKIILNGHKLITHKQFIINDSV